jgi:hypothetical protein
VIHKDTRNIWLLLLLSDKHFHHLNVLMFCLLGYILINQG